MKKLLGIIFILVTSLARATSCQVGIEQPNYFGRTLDTVGDSITWFDDGKYFRCLLRDYGLTYDFKGAHTDPFGFGHDGEGGDTTDLVLQRMTSIAVADGYFLLIGTNDQITPEKTVANIKLIAALLKNKNANSTVYISTVLPRTDDLNQRNQKINALLKKQANFCDKCVLVDLGGMFYSTPNWPNYFLPGGLHPNYKGYELMANYLTPLLK